MKQKLAKDISKTHNDVLLLDHYFNALTTDQRSEIIMILATDVGIALNDAEESLEFDDLKSMYACPEDLECAALFTTLCALNVRNNKYPCTEENHVVLNKSILEVYNELPVDTQRCVCEYLGTNNVAAYIEDSVVVPFLIRNYLVRSDLI